MTPSPWKPSDKLELFLFCAGTGFSIVAVFSSWIVSIHSRVAKVEARLEYMQRQIDTLQQQQLYDNTNSQTATPTPADETNNFYLP